MSGRLQQTCPSSESWNGAVVCGRKAKPAQALRTLGDDSESRLVAALNARRVASSFAASEVVL